MSGPFRAVAALFVLFGVLLRPSSVSAVTRGGFSLSGEAAQEGLQEMASGIARIWALDDSEKVSKYDLYHPLALSSDNSVWDGETIRLFGARNEIVAFQLIIESGSSGAQAVNVRVSDITHGKFIIPNSDSGFSDPFDMRGKHVQLFTEHYLEIEEPSHGGSAWTDVASPSGSYLGWMPDALIPFAAPSDMGGAPFTIPANANQGVWVDLWIPRDAPAGIYTGEVQVSEEGSITHRLTLELQVFNFTLSDETHFKGMFGIEVADIARRHGVKADSEAYFQIVTRYYQMAHRHRFDLVQRVRNLSQMRRFHNRHLTGELYTAKNQYQGPGEGVGNRIFSIGFYGAVPEEYGGDIKSWSQQSWWQGSDAWMRWFRTNAPDVAIHKFLFPDEPASDYDYGMIKLQGEWTDTNPGPGASIPSLVTHTVDPDLKDYIDIWSISANHTLAGTSPEMESGVLNAERSQKRAIGVYNGYRPATGSTLIDTDATDFRVIPWIGWKYDLDHYFYWMTTYWTDWLNGGKRWNIFTNPRTTGFQRNGAGTFFYPGQDAVYIEEDRGLRGPFSSIRMKNWRRGMQDIEYLWEANQLGLHEQAESIVDDVVPNALWEADIYGEVSWPERGYGFEKFRKELAALIASHSEESVPPQGSHAVQIFADVNRGHPSRGEIESLYRQGFLEGCGEDHTHFCPEVPLSRVEASILFGRLIYGPESAPRVPDNQVFEDLPLQGEDWIAASWATALWRDGYLAGCEQSPAKFCPQIYLSRADSAVLLLRYLHGADYQPPAPEGIFSDLSVHWWGASWVEAAYKEGIISACKHGSPQYFCPYGVLTRAEAAILIDKVVGWEDATP